MGFSDMVIPPSLQHKGSKAELAVKFNSLTNRRATSSSEEVRQSTEFGPRQSVVVTTLGVGGKGSGFTYPSFFSDGKGEEVEAAADAPVMRSKDPDSRCVENPDSLVSFACGSVCEFRLLTTLIIG